MGEITSKDVDELLEGYRGSDDDSEEGKVSEEILGIDVAEEAKLILQHLEVLEVSQESDDDKNGQYTVDRSGNKKDTRDTIDNSTNDEDYESVDESIREIRRAIAKQSKEVRREQLLKETMIKSSEVLSLRKNWSVEQENKFILAYAKHGKNWAMISTDEAFWPHFKGRTQGALKDKYRQLVAIGRIPRC